MKSVTKSMPWLLGFAFCALQTSGQSYYPGGLGKTNLVLWLNANKATSITKNGANMVSQWADLSGNGYNFTQATNGNKPVYGAASSPSGRPALTFTSTNSQYLTIPTLPASISFTSGVSTFTVSSYDAPQTAQGWQRIFDFGDGQGSNNLMFGRYGSTASTYYESWNGGNGDQTWTTTSPIVNGADNMYEAIQQGGTVGNLTAVAHYLAGASQAVTGQAPGGVSETWVPVSVARTSNYIGRSNWTADNYFGGAMSEILLYNSTFNTTERIILENYLSAEWDQAISVSKYTPPSATTYGTSLVGIGYTSATDDFLANPSGSTDGLGFSSGTGATAFLHTAGYIMAAHNGQANTIMTNATIPGITSVTNINLWNRSWNVQQSGGNTTGLLTMNFNFSDYNGSTPVATDTYYVLYNPTDGTFMSGTNQLIPVASSGVAGQIVSFGVNAANLPAGYYTLIYSSTPITLPVTLTRFTAEKQSSTSLLDWSVSGQTGLSSISSFDVERSTDATHFDSIASVAGESGSGNFTLTDDHPEAGIDYYRLKMIDASGAFGYSYIVQVDFAHSTSVPVVYPNPVTDVLHINLNSNFPAEISLFNIRGQLVASQSTGASQGTAELPVSVLTAGIYFAEINTGGAKYTLKIIKE